MFIINSMRVHGGFETNLKNDCHLQQFYFILFMSVVQGIRFYYFLSLSGNLSHPANSNSPQGNNIPYTLSNDSNFHSKWTFMIYIQKTLLFSLPLASAIYSRACTL